MEISDKIYVAGHNGMVGSAIFNQLLNKGYKNVITRSSRELDLRDYQSVLDFFESHRPKYVFLAAAKVGGIVANNTYKADFIYDNLMIELNVIKAAQLFKVTKLLFLGSSCIYPKLANQPIKESYLLTGVLEPTNQPYAIAKIAGIELCKSFRDQYNCNFIAAMPTNLYGPNDNYDPINSHVIPGLLRKFLSAKAKNEKEVQVWGSGKPRREFLHVSDLASACILLMQKYDEPEPINIGSGVDISISDLASLIKRITQYNGSIAFDITKPDGTPRKLLDISKIRQLGWQPSINLEKGLTEIVQQLRGQPW